MYLTFSLVFCIQRVFQILITVKGPSLPINIVIAINILLTVPKLVVIPNVKPTVPNALTTSNIISLSIIVGSRALIAKIIIIK